LLLLVVVAGRGVVVDGYIKLPNGDGSWSATGNEGSLRRAVSDWIAAEGASSSTVYTTYGPIEEWGVSDVTNMQYVFAGIVGYGMYTYSTFVTFNADLSKWQTDNVTDMQHSKFILRCSLFQTKEYVASHFFFFLFLLLNFLLFYGMLSFTYCSVFWSKRFYCRSFQVGHGERSLLC
jgi:hypothetical protein